MNISKSSKQLAKDTQKWYAKHNLRLVIFNLIILFLFLLRSAGYFQPYFPLSVNFIVIFSLVLSSVLLGANSKVMFAVTSIFWILAGLFLMLGIQIWSERTGIYAYESFIFGFLLYLFENLKRENNK